MIRVTFAIPGDLATPTGGYAYDRALIAAGPAAGVVFDHLPLPGGFPFPDAAALEGAAAALAAAPADRPLLVDGLALGALPAAALDRVRAPLAALLHHPLALEAGLTAAQAAALEASERAALARAGAIIVTSAATAATAATMFGMGPGSITVARPGLDRHPRAAGGGGAPVLLCVGSLIPRKGHDVLLDALEALADAPWRAHVYGSQTLAPDWAARIAARAEDGPLAGRVSLHGPVDAATLDAAYAGADVFVLPSRYEGYGMVFAEAMARGLPVVAADIAAAREVVPDGCGMFAPVDDAPALATALRRLLDDAPLRDRMGAAAHAAAQAMPGWDATAAAVAAALAPLARRLAS